MVCHINSVVHVTEQERNDIFIWFDFDIDETVTWKLKQKEQYESDTCKIAIVSKSSIVVEPG